jgi:hypothetical protein
MAMVADAVSESRKAAFDMASATLKFHSSTIVAAPAANGIHMSTREREGPGEEEEAAVAVVVVLLMLGVVVVAAAGGIQWRVLGACPLFEFRRVRGGV